ncbi:MAG: putative DNA binding domain-containing protein [Lachnospiraceae bacterium]|jgi:ATP-dependent DNA helicase RecG|nr:putative DNA binding domain-containing protein [Lachnospiraceae bacterium]MCH4064107.1 putative DNA binding domain-containing protein [Lachnospiraceae bacterium]MCH4103168.1 putative DNA binding domain-containing protein [Lachnospiraceae bacterium]MCI1309809.1 putative DNA binding domain-containing protein [Lachnospiraceae bacterium]MCI1334268.1 putative DNA binding domain-containing protein [Lachnospiraceae bacterium]
MKESRQLEFKSDVTNTFLKTVSAYANYDGGQVIFGLDDDGNVVGLQDPVQACLDIENRINDTIHPQPLYELTVQYAEKTVTLKVEPGMNKPYTYKSKAYRRNDTATIQVDNLELNRLIMQGKNIKFDELAADSQDLTFHTLEEQAKKEIGVNALSRDVLKTLNLYSDASGYNHAAELLADQNDFPGIDIARFGENISQILKRVTFQHESILTELEKTVSVYRDFYQYEEIRGIERQKIEKIPEEAFRETIANALIHRTWDVNAQIRVMMFNDRIEITSPGGLPSGISKEEYLRGNVSILRNPIIGNVFFRLHIVEILGTGVIRIKEAYRDSAKKPLFEIYENSTKVVLPVVNSINLTDDEAVVYGVLSKVMPKSISEITGEVPFGRSKTAALLKELAEKKYVIVVGRGRGTKYKV